MTITVFAARKIVTMNPSNPEGTHVAVRDGMILGVGCSSRDNSARGGSEYFRRMQGDKGKLDAAALVEQLHKKGLTRIDSGKTLAFD